MKLTQQFRPMGVETPLGPDVLLVTSMSGREEVGRPFVYELELFSEQPEDVDFKKILGDKMVVRLELSNGDTRYFHGHVGVFSFTRWEGHRAFYHATLVPWLSFLTRRANCRIFQDKSVPQIIKEVFRDHPGIAVFDDALTGNYKVWEYCVQYRETDFNFVSRLMELEGIYYFFKHEKGKHTLVLADSVSAHQPVEFTVFVPKSGQLRQSKELPYFPPTSEVRNGEYLSDLLMQQKVQPGMCVLNEFDFMKPKRDLKTDASALNRDYMEANGEIYDYPGEYAKFKQKEADKKGYPYAKARIDELQSRFETLRGQSNARGIEAGKTVKLSGYPVEAFNKEYLVISASYQLSSDLVASGSDLFSCSFNAVVKTQQYRPARTTPKSVIQGPQTAIVVGPAGEEIWVDEYGRVKVQFHWDRYGKSDQNSSCWVRVSQVWAGKNWGAQFIPRIGHEVIVEFLEGDPDRPIITGSVYNGDNMPTYPPKQHKTQSGIKTRSTKKGEPCNFNEIRFEDKKGEEEIHVHAERNLRTVVEQFEKRYVGADRSTTIQKNETLVIKEGDRTETIEKGNDTLTIQTGHRTETLQKGNESLTIEKGNRTVDIQTGTDTLTLKSDRTVVIHEGSDSLTIEKGHRTETIQKGNESLTVEKGNRTVDIQTGTDILRVEKDRIREVLSGDDNLLVKKGDRAIEISAGNHSLSVPSGDIDFGAPAGTFAATAKTVALDGTQEITLTCGASSIKLTPGEIKIDSPLISINGGLVKINC